VLLRTGGGCCLVCEAGDDDEEDEEEEENGLSLGRRERGATSQSSQSINQSINQPTNQSINQSITFPPIIVIIHHHHDVPAIVPPPGAAAAPADPRAAASFPHVCLMLGFGLVVQVRTAGFGLGKASAHTPNGGIRPRRYGGRRRSEVG
jgi:hypothetical protein